MCRSVTVVGLVGWAKVAAADIAEQINERRSLEMEANEWQIVVEKEGDGWRLSIKRPSIGVEMKRSLLGRLLDRAGT